MSFSQLYKTSSIFVLSFITIVERLFNQHAVKYLGISGIHPTYQRIIISAISILLAPILYITSPTKEFFWNSFYTYTKPKVACCFLCGFFTLMLLSLAIVYITPGILLATFSMQSLFLILLQKLILKNSTSLTAILSAQLFVFCLIIFIIITPKTTNENKSLYLGVSISVLASFLGAIFLTISDIILKRDRIKNVKQIIWNNFFFQFAWGVYFIIFAPLIFGLHLSHIIPLGSLKATDIYILLLLFICVRIYWMSFIGGIILSSSAIMAFLSTLTIPFSYFVDVFRGYLNFSIYSLITSFLLFILLVVILWDQIITINRKKNI